MRWFKVTLAIIVIAASSGYAAAQQPAQNPKPVDDLIQPTLTKRVRPVYPHTAEAARVQGVVVLKASIDRMGKVSNVEIVRSPSDMLNEAAIAAVRQWEYKPATVKGVPISSSVDVELPFYLSDKSALAPAPKARPKK